jgi:hypothetical protein
MACDNLREIIAILGPIRVDSVEGGNGLKVYSSLYQCCGAGAASFSFLERELDPHRIIFES